MVETQKRIFESLIAFVKEERDAYQEVLDRLESSISLNGSVKPVAKPAKKKINPVNATGKMKFSQFLIGVLRSNPNRTYDLSELGDLANESIQTGDTIKPAGKVKDEISKRLFQFIKRGDVIKSDNGYKIKF